MSSTRPRPEDLGREESQPANPDAHAPEEPGDGGTGGHVQGEPGSGPGTGHAQGGPGSGPGTEGHAQGEPESGPEGWQKQLSGLGSFIRMQRRLADMSLREMAGLTSVSNAYLSQIERGLHQPSLRVLRSIAQALSIAPEDLLRRANFMAPKDSGAHTADGAAPGSSSGAAIAGPPDTEAAILADPRLTSAQRDALLNVYRSFRDPT